MDIIIVKE